MSALDLAQDLAYRARALAQAHPLTAQARQYQNTVVEQQKAEQPMPELALWAGMAFLNGYCVRRVEEVDAGLDAANVSPPLEPTDFDAAVKRAAADLRAGTAEQQLLGPEDRTIGALERIVDSEVERRLDHLRDEVDAEAWTELADYLAWWVVVGYAVRVVEGPAPGSGA